MRNVLALAVVLTLVASHSVYATTMGRPLTCKPVLVAGECAEATAYYSVRTADNGVTANVSLIKLEPDGRLRPWAECVAAKWRSFQPLNQASVPGSRIVEFRFRSNGCEPSGK